LVVARLDELGGQDVGPDPDRVRRHDALDPLAEPVVHVVQSPVPEVQAVPARDAAVREQDAVRLGLVDRHARGDRERPAPDVDRDRLGHVGAVGVDAAVARRARLRPRGADDLGAVRSSSGRPL